MIKKFKSVFASLAILGVVAAPALVPAVAYAQGTSTASPEIANGLCAGVTFKADQTNSCDPDSQGATQQVNAVIKLIINIFSLAVGFVSVIMIVIGGFRYITSGGEANNITAAKNTIIYAIIGLVIVALAQFIVRFVLGKVTTGV